MMPRLTFSASDQNRAASSGAVLLALSVMALSIMPVQSVAAQQASLGGFQVEIRSDPQIPVAGQPATAIAEFIGVSASDVSLFIRPVGESEYTQIAGVAQAQNPRVFRAAIPGVIPPQGVEVYASYDIEGVTFTEPSQDPEAFPYRVPALSIRATSDLTLPARQYRMVTIPFHLGNNFGDAIPLGSDDPEDVFGDDFGAGADPSQWRLQRIFFNDDGRSSRGGFYVDYALDPEFFGPVRPGDGYWLITARGGTFDVEQGLSTGTVFDGQSYPTAMIVTLQPGWNQIGNPFLIPFQWEDVQISDSGIQEPVAFRGSYSVGQQTLMPWEGYFVFNGGDGFTNLRFEIQTTPTGGGKVLPLTERLLERAGTGAFLLDVQADLGPDRPADHLYLGRVGSNGEAADRLAINKPPAIDEGVQMAVESATGDLAGAFVASDAPASWDISIGQASGRTLDLRLAEHGARPEGMVLTVDDLDQGVSLPVFGDRVTVPALAGATDRKLRIRFVPEGSVQADVAFGRPHPNPFVDDLVLPLVVPDAGPARVEVYDLLGRRVRTLHNGVLDAGTHMMHWDGRDDGGRRVATGAYLVRLDAGSASAVARVTLLR